ncbi:MAG: diphosphate--fructose-6-phosphate 1-phosphotransferase [Planctomycetota bacterium]
MQRNVLVAQSGGPSPVLNASLQGVFDACSDRSERIGRVLAAWHGVEGILQEELIDLTAQPREEMALLKVTTSAGAIGTCRYKLRETEEEDFRRILDVFRAHSVGFFFYIGGNDSMDTALKVSRLARERGMDLVVAGVPKTIDNDVGDPDFRLIDHTPGYGSAARYWAHVVRDLDEENRGMSPSECVCVIQAMGRKSGFLPAAARLADPERRMPLQIYTAESGHNLESLAECVNRELQTSGRSIVVVSEGFDVGSLGEARDGFGHIEYGASKLAAAQVVASYLNEKGLRARGQASWQVPGVLQRSTSIYASAVDIEEAYEVGRHAVEVAFRDGTGWMATILRSPGDTYRPLYDKVPLERVANSVRGLPASWIAPGGTDVTDDFVRYARPLMGDAWPEVRLERGLPRFARLRLSFLEKRLAPYVPVRYR